jgi:hypothetical protein
VAAGVRVLGAEGRPKCVDLGQRQAVGLDIELSRDRQEGLAAKEILREIDLVLGVLGRFTKSNVDSRNLNALMQTPWTPSGRGSCGAAAGSIA